MIIMVMVTCLSSAVFVGFCALSQMNPLVAARQMNISAMSAPYISLVQESGIASSSAGKSRRRCGLFVQPGARSSPTAASGISQPNLVSAVYAKPIIRPNGMGNILLGAIAIAMARAAIVMVGTSHFRLRRGSSIVIGSETRIIKSAIRPALWLNVRNRARTINDKALRIMNVIRPFFSLLISVLERLIIVRRKRGKMAINKPRPVAQWL